MKIYLDLLLIQNTFIMFLILFIFNKVLNLKNSIVRILTVSLLTSIFSIVILISLPKLYDNLFIKLIISFFIINFGMKVKLKNEVLLKIIILWIIAILFGGIGILSDGNIAYSVVLFVLFGIIILKLDSKKKNKLFLEAATCFLEFEYGNHLYKLKALVDTGHSVKTIYDEDVIFVKNVLINIEGGDIKGKRNVSYKTVSGISQKKGVKVYNINISYGNRKIKNNAVIVSTPNISDNFDAIVSLSLVEGGCSYGNIDFNEGESKKIFS